MSPFRKHNFAFLEYRTEPRDPCMRPRAGLKGTEEARERRLAEGGPVKGTMSFRGSNFGDKSLDPIMSAAPARYGPCH